jgi:hypothetical protein
VDIGCHRLQVDSGCHHLQSDIQARVPVLPPPLGQVYWPPSSAPPPGGEAPPWGMPPSTTPMPQLPSSSLLMVRHILIYFNSYIHNWSQRHFEHGRIWRWQRQQRNAVTCVYLLCYVELCIMLWLIDKYKYIYVYIYIWHCYSSPRVMDQRSITWINHTPTRPPAPRPPPCHDSHRVVTDCLPDLRQVHAVCSLLLRMRLNGVPPPLLSGPRHRLDVALPPQSSGPHHCVANHCRILTDHHRSLFKSLVMTKLLHRLIVG